MARTPQEKAVDCLLTTYLIEDAFSRCKLRFMSETKLQKLVFLSERSMIDERKKGFNFSFIKLTFGPFSQELRNDRNDLLKTGFLMGSRPTDDAKLILEDFENVLERNKPFFQKIDAINNCFAKMPLPQLLDFIYAMPWGKGRTIDDLPQLTPMLYPMKQTNVALEFSISEEEAEDLLMNFDPQAIRELHQAMSDMREGRTRTYEQVFSNL